MTLRDICKEIKRVQAYAVPVLVTIKLPDDTYHTVLAEGISDDGNKLIIQGGGEWKETL